MNLSAAVFRRKRPFAYTDSDQVFKKQGEQVNDGLELTAAGNVWQGLNIYSGVTFLKAELTDTGNKKTEDKRVVGVPKVQANLLAEYSLPSVPQWVYSADIHYTGKRAANDTNTRWADSYITLRISAERVMLTGEAPGPDAAAKTAHYERYFRDNVRRVQERLKNVPGSARLRVYHSMGNPLTPPDDRRSIRTGWIWPVRLM